MKKETVVRRTAKTLENAGYATVVVRNIHTCIDIFASKLNRTIAVKAAYNIDSVSKSEIQSMLNVSGLIGAESVIVGENSQNGILKDGVVYTRFDAECISTDTFHIFEEDRMSEKASKSAGVKVKVDSSRLRWLMKLNRLNASELALIAGISNETVYKYENGDTYASKRIAMKLERILNGKITCGFERKKGWEAEGKKSRFGKTDMNLFMTGNAPFSGIMKRKNTYEISYDANPRTMVKRAVIFEQLHELLDSNYPFFVSRKGGRKVRKIPVISEKSISGIKHESELMDLLSV